MRRLDFLLDHTVCQPGEEVAAVAALTPDVAEEALKLIDVDYDVLPAVIDPEEALRADAPLARADYGRSTYRGSDTLQFPGIDEEGWLRVEVGDLEEGFRQADHIVENRLVSPMQYNCSPLPRAVVCDWQGDKLTCWADTQVAMDIQKDIAASLDLPQASVRLISQDAVGGYGGKSPDRTAALVALMARRTGRPVKAEFSRSEDFIGTHHRIGYTHTNRVGVTNEGSITAMSSTLVANWGSDSMVPMTCQGNSVLRGPCMLYRCPNVSAGTIGVLTNMPAHGSMNGFGDTEAMYAIETVIDEAAEAISMDPVAFRLKNCARYGDRAVDAGQVLRGRIEWGVLGPDFDAFPQLISQCAEQAGWHEKWKGWRTPVAVDGPRRSGIGIAIGMHTCAYWPASAIVKMSHDGSAVVLTGGAEIGQGYATACAQVAAEVLGIPYEHVSVITADTSATPAILGNVASSGTSSGINAVKIAAEEAKAQILQAAAARLSAAVDALEVGDGRVFAKESGDSVSIAEICSAKWQITGSGNNPPFDSIRDPRSGKVIFANSAAVTVAEVDVDTETGRADVTRITSGHDTGRTINPLTVENQIDMGLVMATGWLLREDYKIDPDSGILLNPNLLDYKLCTILDIPERDRMNKFTVEIPSAWGPFGAKGFSETAMIALGPAIANAMYNATGVRMRCGSLTPQNVLGELRGRRPVAVEKERG